MTQVQSATHIRRSRLVEATGEARLVLIEAPGGYGKSVLLDELRDSVEFGSLLAAPSGETELAAGLVGALGRGMRRAGLSDLAAELDHVEPSSEAVLTAVDRFPEPLLIVVDEGHRARGDAAELLIALTHQLPERHRMAIAGRRLDERLRAGQADGAVAYLGRSELAFDDSELEALLDAALGAPPTAAQIEHVRRVSGGWPAAAALAAAQMAAGPVRGPRWDDAADGVATLVDQALARLAPQDALRVAALGYLPLLSRDVAQRCAGPEAFGLLLEAGLPLRVQDRGFWALPEPIRDELARRAPFDPRATREAAEVYARSGELPTAFELLTRRSLPESVLALLADLDWHLLAPLGLEEVTAVLGTLPESAFAQHPYALVQVARRAELAAAHDTRASLHRRALMLLAPGPARREAAAEFADASALIAPSPESAELAREVLAEAAPDELIARARALRALARVETSANEAQSLLAAESRLVEAVALFALAGERHWQAMTLTNLGYNVVFARGDLEKAIVHIRGALALVAEARLERGLIADCAAYVLAYAGRLDDAEAAWGEGSAIAHGLGDHRLLAYVAWTGGVISSLRGDLPVAVQRLRSVERYLGRWFDSTDGVEFLTDAACAMARLGDREQAARFAERARAHAQAVGVSGWEGIAIGAVEARFGDPERAEEALLAYLSSPHRPPREEWRTLLMRAYAAQRGGDGAAAGDLAAQAYAAAAMLGVPQLPEINEPDVAAALAGSAARAGSSDQATVRARPTDYALTLLGEFSVSADRRPRLPPPGRPSTLVKLLAAAGGPVPVEQVIEALWPEGDPTAARGRLRNLLSRIKTECGDLVLRAGESLVLSPSSSVDAWRFAEAAATALTAVPDQRPGLARAAISMYGGELLPDDRYADWAAAPRDRLRRQYLDLLDLLVDERADAGDIDEAIRLLELAQTAEPFDDERYLRAAELMLFQGRRGSARRLVEQAAGVRESLGLSDSPRITRLKQATGTGARDVR